MAFLKSFCRFCIFSALLFLFSFSIYADERAIPTEYPSFLDAVNAPYAWSLGFTGKNVVVGVVDDSVEMNHPFYSSNIDRSLAYNTGIVYNAERFKQEYLPTLPTQSATNTSAIWDQALVLYPDMSDSIFSKNDHHGTCVTGCIAAYDVETHTYGPAYDVTIVPIRVDFRCQTFHATFENGSSVASYTFGQAIAYKNSVIDIKNNSYGTSTGYSGKDVEAQLAGFVDARANNTILLFAAGNERNKNIYTNGKDCTKKVYASHPFTIAVASTGHKNAPDYTQFSKFSNYGSCVFTCAPGYKIQTSDRDDVRTGNVFTYECEYVEDFEYQGNDYGNMDSSFNGTSGASPVAAGVLALALDAYKTTYPDQVCDVRFIKHLLVRTSTKIDLEETDRRVAWTTNAAGVSFSPSYGFGQINAKGLIDAILDPESVLGGNFDTVTPQTVASINWSTMEVSPNESIAYGSTHHDNSSGLSFATTFDEPQNDILSAAVEYQSGGTADYVTPNVFQPLAADETLVYSDTITISDETFLNSGIVKQDLEEVTVTLTAAADNLETGFDSRYMEIILDHNGLQSILAFSDTTSPKENHDSITWTFTSNAFWGEDPLGDWTLSVFNVGADEPFSISNVYSTFYMGEMRSSAVPEPSTWGLLLLSVAGLFLRKRVRN